MSFPFNVYAVAFLSSIATALVALPLWQKWCWRAGLVDEPGHRKIHDETIALAGGLGVMTALAIPAIVGAVVFAWHYKGGSSPPLVANLSTNSGGPVLDSTTESLMGYGVNKRSFELAAILFGAFGMLMVGLCDDKFELKPAVKFTFQFLVAGIVAAAGARITLFVHNIVFSYAVTILWILTVTNAFNFMDNMNGLCAGLGAIGSMYFALIAGADGQYLVTLLGLMTCGALLGFLPYNFPKARAFLGDSGSHLVGFLLAVLAILPHFYTKKHPHVSAVFLPLLVLAVPLGDLVRVVLVRWKLGKPFYVGDNNHLSHRLVQAGLNRTRAVLLIWFIAALVGAGALVDWDVLLTH